MYKHGTYICISQVGNRSFCSFITIISLHWSCLLFPGIRSAPSGSALQGAIAAHNDVWDSLITMNTKLCLELPFNSGNSCCSPGSFGV